MLLFSVNGETPQSSLQPQAHRNSGVIFFFSFCSPTLPPSCEWAQPEPPKYASFSPSRRRKLADSESYEAAVGTWNMTRSIMGGKSQLACWSWRFFSLWKRKRWRRRRTPRVHSQNKRKGERGGEKKKVRVAWLWCCSTSRLASVLVCGGYVRGG